MLRPELELGPEFLPFKLSDSVEHIYAHAQRERERDRERERERERKREKALILYHDAVECKVVKYNEN